MMSAEELKVSDKSNQESSSDQKDDDQQRATECLKVKTLENEKFKDNLFANSLEIYSQTIQICPTYDSTQLFILYINGVASNYPIERDTMSVTYFPCCLEFQNLVSLEVSIKSGH